MAQDVHQVTWSEDVHLSGQTRSILSTISKWTKFLSIVGFIMLTISVLLILSAGTLITSVNRYMQVEGFYPYNPGTFEWTYAIMYLIVIAIYFIPVYYLYKFSVRIKEALATNNDVTLTEAFKYLNSHYTWFGILTIIGLIIFAIALLFMIVAFTTYM